MRFLLSTAVVLVLVVGCAPEKAADKPAPYADLTEVYSRVTEIQDQLIAGLSAAQDGDRVATVIRTYASKMREAGPALARAQGNHPELRSSETPPAELAATVAALNASTGRMMDSLAKVQQFMDDEAVVAAMGDLTKAAQAQFPDVLQ